MSTAPGSTTRSVGPRVVLLQVVEGQWATYPLGDVQLTPYGDMQCSERRYHMGQDRDAMHLLSCGTPSSDCMCMDVGCSAMLFLAVPCCAMS
jgi:hypothetical protein